MLDTWTSIPSLPSRSDGFQDVQYKSARAETQKWQKEEILDVNPGLQGLGMLSFEVLDLTQDEARAITDVDPAAAEGHRGSTKAE